MCVCKTSSNSFIRIKYYYYYFSGLPANLEIREKSGNQILSQIVREKSGNFQFLTKSQGKWGKVREKLFVAMITFNNVFFIVYFNFYYL